eukprot:8780583-Alexandrium_andersonii.AAC.1
MHSPANTETTATAVAAVAVPLIANKVLGTKSRHAAAAASMQHGQGRPRTSGQAASGLQCAALAANEKGSPRAWPDGAQSYA